MGLYFGWVSIKGQRIQLSNICGIIDTGDTIEIESNKGAFLIFTTRDDQIRVPGRVTVITHEEYGKIKLMLKEIGEVWV